MHISECAEEKDSSLNSTRKEIYELKLNEFLVLNSTCKMQAVITIDYHAAVGVRSKFNLWGDYF